MDLLLYDVGVNVELWEIIPIMTQKENNKYFVGRFNYSLDSKDRLNIPSRFRRIMPNDAEERFVFTKGFEKCLHMYPSNYWHEFVTRYWSMFQSNEAEARKFAIWCYRDTYEAQLDNQGRIQIPKPLLEYAGLEKEVMIIGYNTRIELWNPRTCDDFVGKDDEKFMRMAAEFSSKAYGNPAQNYPSANMPPNYPPANYYNPYPNYYNPGFNPYNPMNQPGQFPQGYGMAPGYQQNDYMQYPGPQQGGNIPSPGGQIPNPGFPKMPPGDPQENSK